jgi:integrase
MATKLTDIIVKRLPVPAAGYEITWDAQVAGFGARVTAGGARSFILNYRTRIGRMRRFTIGTFPSWSTGAARDESRKLKTAIDRGGDPLGELKAGRAAPTVSDLCDRFIAEHLPRKRSSTQRTYQPQIDNVIRPALGGLKVAEVTFSDIDGLHRKITARGTAYRANRVIALLSRMFSMAIKWRMRADNPVKGIERNQEQKRQRYLTGAELTRLTTALAEMRDQGAANAVRLLLLTGARRGELLAARWGDIDLDAGIWVKPGATTKQKTTHRVPLSAAACRLLAEMRAQDGGEWLFPNPQGDGARPDIRAAWEALRKAANIPDVRTHDLRHSYASILASAGLSLPIIGALLGHTQASTTLRYAHLLDDPLRQATERAAAVITGKSPAEVVPLSDRRRG